jgi:hypothetical protein
VGSVQGLCPEGQKAPDSVDRPEGPSELRGEATSATEMTELDTSAEESFQDAPLEFESDNLDDID